MEHDPNTEDIGPLLARRGTGRENLIPILQEVQERTGHLSRAAIHQIAAYLSLSATDVYGVATFYTQFRFHPVGRYHIRVCCGTACHVRGAAQITERVEHDLGIAAGETTPDRQFSLEKVACFGSCALAPVVVVNTKAYGRMTFRKSTKLIGSLK